jgi:ABC-2 type transport system permease protein
MNLRRVGAIARKELLHVVRDPRSLAMGIAIPAMLLILFGYGLSLDVDHVPMAILDMDNSPESREVVRAFTNSPAFDLEESCGSMSEIEHAVQSGRATAALILPRGFSEETHRGYKPVIQVILDGSDPNTARLAGMYARRILAGAGGGVSMMNAYNPSMDTTWSIVPGLIAIIVNVIAAMLTSLCIAREWENGTMEQLVSTPVRKSEFVAGKLAPYYAIGVIDVAAAVLMALLLFGIPLRGSVVSLALVSGVFLLGALSVGLFISIAAGSQLLASQVSLVVTFLPGFILSGFVYDTAAMPAVVSAITRIIPARYFVTLLRAVFLKGTWGWNLTVDLLLLTAFTAVMLFLSIRKLKLHLDGR